MNIPDNRDTGSSIQVSDRDRLTCLAGMLCPVMFALGYWAMVIAAALTDEFKPATLIIAGLETVAAWLGVHGWRKRTVMVSYVALAVMIGAFMLSKPLI
ncbi:hypothetical protein [Streptomyces rubiginosohelvolus]